MASVPKDFLLKNLLFQMIKMLIVVVACYTVCWLPFNVFYVLGLAKPEIYQETSFPYFFTIFHIMAVSHTCYNPFIYCWMNIRIRYGFMDVLEKCTLIRKCCFWIDWNTPRLNRSTNASQYHNEQNHYINRNRLTINGRTSHSTAMEM